LLEQLSDRDFKLAVCTNKIEPHTLKELDVAQEKAVLIGDTHIDASCAAHCNVDFILHQSGYGVPSEPEYRIAGQFNTYADMFA
jgi:phosphoglycolate phosphatase-like HAD superfamily hydrolase